MIDVTPNLKKEAMGRAISDFDGRMGVINQVIPRLRDKDSPFALVGDSLGSTVSWGIVFEKWRDAMLALMAAEQEEYLVYTLKTQLGKMLTGKKLGKYTQAAPTDTEETNA